MKKFVQVLLLGFLVITLSGCPGESSSDDGPTFTGLSDGSGSSGSSGSGDSSTTTDSSTVTQRLGSFDSGTGSFNEGAIAANDTTLSAGESSNLSVSIVDQDGNLITDSADVFFTSNCVASGLAEVDPPIATNSTGTINATYSAIGCDGNDTVRAQTTLDGTTLSATVIIATSPAPLGSITFDSTSLNVIGIKGSGGAPETAIVTFKVTNSAGGPAQNQVVDFELNNTLGGITLGNTQATTNSQGLASTTVNSGEIATTVVVTATATQGSVTTSARSRSLAITTGIPDQNSLSMSATTLNIEGAEFDGITTEINVRLADRFNNPVADGTAVSFTTEGGSIDGSCITENGFCSVTLTSQEPRPPDGRVTVRATALGEESFDDVNPTNGRFDDTDTLFSIPEAFLDNDGDGVFDQGQERFVDFNGNDSHDAADGNFDGLLCNGPGLCGNSSVIVFKNMEIVFSGSSNFTISVIPDPIVVGADDVNFSVFVQDSNGQKPPAGSTVEVSASQGQLKSGGGVVGSVTKTMADDNDPGAAEFEFTIGPSGTAGNGKLNVTVTTPKGVITEDSFDINQP